MTFTALDTFAASVVCLGLMTCLVIAIGRRLGCSLHVPGRMAADVLDTPLLYWTSHDPFSARALLAGGVAIFGRVGSGKTSSSGKLLASRIVGLQRAGTQNRSVGLQQSAGPQAADLKNGGPKSDDLKTGGLILAAKPEDLAMWQGIFAKAGRSNDLLMFSPDSPLRFNFLDYEMKHGGHTRNITQCLFTIGESLRAGDARGGVDQEMFWRQQQERMIYNAVEVVKRATGKVTAPDLQRFIVGAAMTLEQLTSDAWRVGFHCKCLEAGHNATKTPIEANDFQLAIDYWLGEFPAMADKTRSSILAGVMGILHVFNTGLVRELVSNETNVTPDEMFNGKWIMVNMSPTEYGELGSFICAGWKYLTQRRVLRREAKSGDSINVIWADEAHQFVNSFDAHYLAQCRSHLGCMVFLSQSLSGYHAALKGEAGKHQALSLLGNFTHTIFHAVDAETAEWASKKLGKRRESLFGGSSAPPTDVFDALLGNHGMTSSFSEHYEPVVQENVFMNGLRTGGTANGLQCDAIVIKSGEPFSSGENWLFRTFSQTEDAV